MPVNDSWYTLIDGEQRGPVTFDELLHQIRMGHLCRDHLIWSPGFAEWQAASKIPGLFAPPPPASSIFCREHPIFERSEKQPSNEPALKTVPEPEPEIIPHHSGDPTEISYPVKGIAAAGPAPKEGNYFLRHWRGELSLPVSYWVNGFIVNTVLLVLVGVLMAAQAPDFERSLRFSFIALLYLSSFGRLSASGGPLISILPAEARGFGQVSLKQPSCWECYAS